MMSTQSQAEHGVIQSSIALLQERFKQLQRVKEMREKKELLTMFSDNYQINYTTNTTTTTTSNNDLGDVVDVNDDEVQIFLPPNYYCSNRKPSSSCYYSSSSLSSLSSSSSSSVLNNNNNDNNNNNNNNNNVNEISLSLWPPAMSYTGANATAAAAAAEHLRRAKIETPHSTTMTTSSTRPSCCVSSAYNKFEDYSHHHVSDVDTTLHL